MDAPEKASLDLKRPVIVANSSKTGEEILQSGIPECNSKPGIGTTVLSGLRNVCVTSGLIFLLIMTVTLKYSQYSRLA
jgi:hypothetical protein